jgi:hypothetical protein
MDSILSAEEPSLSSDELKRARESAKTRFRLWRKRSLYCAGALLLSCASIYPFVDGRRLSGQEELIKQGLLLLWLVLIIATLYTTLLFWGAWRILRDIELGRI